MSQRIKRYVTIFLCTLIGTVITGCSSGTPTANRIKDDLNLSEFVDASELYNNENGNILPVTDITVYKTTRENTYCAIDCHIIQEDENYRKESDAVVEYNQYDGWELIDCNMSNVKVAPIAPMPDYLVDAYAHNAYEKNGIKNIELSNITHNFNQSEETDNITMQCVVTSETCRRTLDIAWQCTFNNRWQFSDKKNEISREWLFSDLEGTTWLGHPGGVGTRTIKINNFDTANQTVSIDYGYSSLTHSEVCKYEIKEDTSRYGSFDKPVAIVIPMTYDFYDMEILEDRIWCSYGGEMKKMTE